MHTLSEAVKRYKAGELPRKSAETQRHQKQQLDWFVERIGGVALDKVTRSRLCELRDELLAGTTKLKKAPRSGGSVNRYLAALSAVYEAAIEWEWVETNPVRLVKKPKESKGRVRFLRADETTRLFAACDESENRDLAPLVELALHSGMRKGELLRLRWEEVDWRDIDGTRCAVFCLTETKNGETRHVPVPAAHIPRVMLSRRDVGPLFAGDPREAWEQALRRAKVANFRFHDLRHSFASHLARSGVNSLAIANCLGHKSMSMVRRYSHLGPDDGAAASVRAGAY